MDFNFNVARALRLRTKSGIVCLDSRTVDPGGGGGPGRANALTNTNTSLRDPYGSFRTRSTATGFGTGNHGGGSTSSGIHGDKNHGNLQQQVFQVVDLLGKASARAQGLKQAVTCPYRLMGTADQRLYLMVIEAHTVVGIIKVGRKKLFIAMSLGAGNGRRPDTNGGVKEIEPLSVLDFYISEQFQRQGYGKKLFQYMLDCEKTTPSKVAYDRPSEKFLRFLEKHYGLKSYTPQNNNFVVYHKYFQEREPNSAAFPQVPCPLEEDGPPGTERFRGVLEGKYVHFRSDDPYGVDAQQHLGPEVPAASHLVSNDAFSASAQGYDHDVEGDRSRAFADTVAMGQRVAQQVQAQQRGRESGPGQGRDNQETFSLPPRPSRPTIAAKSKISQKNGRGGPVNLPPASHQKVHFSQSGPERHAYQPVDDSHLPFPAMGLSSIGFADMAGEFFASKGGPKGIGKGADPRSGHGVAKGIPTQSGGVFDLTLNPIARGNDAIKKDTDILNTTGGYQSMQGFASDQPKYEQRVGRGNNPPKPSYGGNGVSQSVSPTKFRTMKQKVDAEVNRLKQEHPVFTSEVVQEMMREKEQEKGFKRGSSVDTANMAHTNAVHGRVIQREQGFTRPVYLHNRDKHYAGSGVAGLLGAGAAFGGPGGNSNYQTSYLGGRAAGGGGTVGAQLGRDEIRRAHNRKGPFF